IPTQRTAWAGARRVGGVSSFGASGTNAHVVLEEAPPLAPLLQPAEEPAVLLCLSARDQGALADLARAYQRFLTEVPSERCPGLTDIAHTAAARRSHHAHRIAVVGRSRAELCTAIDAWLREDKPSAPLRAHGTKAVRQKVVFVFTGQ